MAQPELPSLWQSLSVPRDWLPWIYFIALFGCGLVGATVIYSLYNGSRLEVYAALLSTFASLLVAFGTILLARFTATQAQATKDILANENNNFRKSQTARLIERYFQTPIQISAEQSLTPQNAYSEIILFAGNLPLVQELKQAMHKKPVDEEDTKRRRQYRAIKGAFTVILNFYSACVQLYSEDVIDKRMFLNGFAKSFISLWKAMPQLNDIVQAYEPERLKGLEPFKAVCESWLQQK